MIRYSLTLRSRILIDPALRPADLAAQLRGLKRDLDGVVDAYDNTERVSTARPNANWFIRPIRVDGADREEAELRLTIVFEFADANPLEVHRSVEGASARRGLKQDLAVRIGRFYRDADYVIAHALVWDDVVDLDGQSTTFHRLKRLRGQGGIAS